MATLSHTQVYTQHRTSPILDGEYT